MNYKLDKKKFDDIYFEGKPMYDKVNGGTFNVVYCREYIDPESESETLNTFRCFRKLPQFATDSESERMYIFLSPEDYFRSQGKM